MCVAQIAVRTFSPIFFPADSFFRLQTLIHSQVEVLGAEASLAEHDPRQVNAPTCSVAIPLRCGSFELRRISRLMGLVIAFLLIFEIRRPKRVAKPVRHPPPTTTLSSPSR